MQWSCAWELVRDVVPAVPPSPLAVYTIPRKLDCGGGVWEQALPV